MAELILTDEEKATESYLDWDDAAIGKAVKKLALAISDTKGDKSMSWHAASLCLVAMAHDSNAGSSEHTIEGVTLNKGQDAIGDWKITTQRTDDG